MLHSTRQHIAARITLLLFFLVQAALSGCAPALSPQEMYTLAVHDAMVAEESEIQPLVVLVPGSDLATFNAAGDKVFLLTWHKRPQNYTAGQEITMGDWRIWTFTDKEIAAWYRQNAARVTNWPQRLEQLIGLPPNASYTHVSALWVSPSSVVRPAYCTGTASPSMAVSFVEEADPAYKQWFDNNILFSYFYGAYPWTRLGYTYDWANNGTEYGLSEFLIQPHSTITVEWTKTTEEFLAWLATQK